MEEWPCWSEIKWTNYIRILGIDSEIMVYMEKFPIELISNVSGNFLFGDYFYLELHDNSSFCGPSGSMC
jgi:hypothetical protein